MKHIWFRAIALAIVVAVSLGCGGGGGGSDPEPVVNNDSGNADSNNNTNNGDTANNTDTNTTIPRPATISLSGKAVAAAADVQAVATLFEKIEYAIASLNPFQFVWAASETGAEANQAVAGATVTLYKISADSDTAEEQVDIGEVVTDDDGNYTIPDVPTPPEGEGADSDFYYEVRVTKSELELTAPAAPDEDTEVNVSPETDIAAKILSDVVDVPNVASDPLPNAKMIEAMRRQVMQNAANLIDRRSMAIPSAVGSSRQSVRVATANGMAATGGNAEKMYKAASFQAE